MRSTPLLSVVWLVLAASARGTPSAIAPFVHGDPSWTRANGMDHTAEQLLHLVLEITGSGVASARRMADALQNSTWVDAHGDDLALAVASFTRNWDAISQLAEDWRTSHENPRPTAALSDGVVVAVVQPLLSFGLLCASIAAVRGRPPLDLFSPEVHSRTEVALAFTIASFVSLALVNGWNLNSIDNPFTLYVAQLLLCFVGTTTTVPVVAGTRRGSPKWMVLGSLGVVVWFLSLWLTSDISILILALSSDEPELRDASTPYTITALSFALLVLSTSKVAHVLGFRRRCTEPFYTRHAWDCNRYLHRLVNLRPGREKLVHVPTALLVALLGVGSFMLIIVTKLVTRAWRDFSGVQDLTITYEYSLQPVIAWAGLPKKSVHDARFSMTRTLVCFYVALGVGTVYVAWLLHSVLRGYRRLFCTLMKAQSYPGKEIVQRSGPGVFHAKWATYVAGALIGNCVMAFFFIGSQLFVLFLVLSASQFWTFMWAGRRWYILYALLYVTRYCIFRFIIPRYVVTNEGAVLRRRVWALLFPTLMLLNFIIGATSGVLRAIVMWPFLLVNFFRVDVTFLPSGLVDWDWSFQPFMSLVVHSHSRLNPIMFAAVARLARAGQLDPSAGPGGAEPPRARGRQVEVAGQSAAAVAARAGAGDEAEAEARAGAGVSRARAGSGPLAVAPIQAPGAKARAAEDGAEADPAAQRPNPRARSRWLLAVTLARNPSLRPARGHALRAAREAGQREVRSLSAPSGGNEGRAASVDANGELCRRIWSAPGVLVESGP